jgi:hypothetical protein
MMKHTYDKLFFGVSAFATLLVLTEIVMQFFGASICPTEGCKVVAEHVRYGDLSILLIGFATFSLLALFSGLGLFANRAVNPRYGNAVLIVALACEGYFTGYQAFAVHTPCLFCLVIFGIIVLLGCLRLVAGEWDLIAGFAACAAVFGMLYLVPPAGGSVDLPKGERLVLFYSKDCKHCAEIKKELEENRTAVTHLAVAEYAEFLKNMGIEHVPTLMVNDPYQKIFLTGKDAIRRYLAACAEPERVPETRPGKGKSKAGTSASPPEAGAVIDIFSMPELLSGPGSTAAQDGMCREEEICK